MAIEYLLFNILVLAGPLAFSFEDRLHFISRLRQVIAAVAPVALVFLVWDAHVSGRHWFFNPAYTLDIRIAGLPPGEWLFFCTVPYASLFVWENVRLYVRRRTVRALAVLRPVLYIAVPVGVVLFGAGREYTGLALVAVGMAALLDRALRTDLFAELRTYVFLAVSTILILLCNGYLTARPVVTYAEQYQLGIRIITIPVEDFFYGYALLLAAVILYEALRRTQPDE